MNKKENILILHNIRSVENVGAMFRTADAAGIDKIYLAGYTPTPLDRFGRRRKDLHKSALGAEEFVRWEHKKSISALLAKLKKEKYYIIAIEQDKKSVNYKEIKTKSTLPPYELNPYPKKKIDSLASEFRSFRAEVHQNQTMLMANHTALEKRVTVLEHA